MCCGADSLTGSFGLADTVATLLRSDGQFWYAEDSFLVQIKSRTEASLTFEKPVSERWLAQDLSVFVGRLNLNNQTRELYTTGTTLFDPDVLEARELTLWLQESEAEKRQDGVLHRNLTKPIVRFSVKEAEKPRLHGSYLRNPQAMARIGALEQAILPRRGGTRDPLGDK